MNIGGMGAITNPTNTYNGWDIQKAGSGDNVYSVLPLALQVAAQTIALDLVPVVPMQGPLGRLQYLDYVYEGGRLNDMGGSEYTSAPTTNGYGNVAAPYMIKGLIKLSADSDKFVPNTVYQFDDYDQYELTYIYPARIDGKPIFRVIEKSLHFGKNMLGGEGADTPIYELFERLTAEGSDQTKLVAVDSTSTNIEVEKSEGVELVRAFEDHVTSFSGAGFLGKNVTSNNPYTREQGEATPGRQIGLRSYTLDVRAETFQVNSAITREQVQDLKQFGIDAVAQAEAALVNELTQCINKVILEKVFNLGALNAMYLEEVEGKNQVSAIFSNGTTTATDEIWLGFDKDNQPIKTGAITPTKVTGGGEVMGTVQRRIMSKIIAASNIIAVRGRRGAGTFAVVSGMIGTALQDCAGFMPYPLANNINANGNSLYPIGNLAGISIYIDPNMAFNDCRVCVGRKGKENEPGVVFMPYLMADKVETISEFTFAPAISMKSRFAVVEAGQHPETQYYTFGIKLVDGVTLV